MNDGKKKYERYSVNFRPGAPTLYVTRNDNFVAVLRQFDGTLSLVQISSGWCFFFFVTPSPSQQISQSGRRYTTYRPMCTRDKLFTRKVVGFAAVHLFDPDPQQRHTARVSNRSLNIIISTI